MLGYDLNKISKRECPNFTFAIYQWQLLSNWFWDTDNLHSRSSAVRKQHPYKLLVVGAIPTGSILGKDLFLVRRLRVYKPQQEIRKNLNPTVMVKVS